MKTATTGTVASRPPVNEIPAGKQRLEGEGQYDRQDRRRQGKHERLQNESGHQVAARGPGRLEHGHVARALQSRQVEDRSDDCCGHQPQQRAEQFDRFDRVSHRAPQIVDRPLSADYPKSLGGLVQGPFEKEGGGHGLTPEHGPLGIGQGQVDVGPLAENGQPFGDSDYLKGRPGHHHVVAQTQPRLRIDGRLPVRLGSATLSDRRCAEVAGPMPDHVGVDRRFEAQGLGHGHHRRRPLGASGEQRLLARHRHRGHRSERTRNVGREGELIGAEGVDGSLDLGVEVLDDPAEQDGEPEHQPGRHGGDEKPPPPPRQVTSAGGQNKSWSYRQLPSPGRRYVMAISPRSRAQGADRVNADQLPDVFAALPARARRSLAMRKVKVAAGEILFRAGEPSDGLVAVLSGEVELVATTGTILGLAGAGELLGEIGFLLAQPRSATARAGENGAEVGIIGAAEVQRVLERHPAVALELSRSLSRKLLDTTESIGTHETRIALLIGDHPALLSELARTTHAQVGVVSLDGTPRAPRRKAFVEIDEGELLAHLRAREPRLREFALVIVRSGPERQLISETVAPVADWVIARGQVPSWIPPGNRLIADDEAGIQRAVRWLTGTAIGLALSSGGSKTVAHIGVLDALAESGVPIDAITGSSGGAAFAAGHLSGGSIEELTVGAGRLGDVLNGRRFEIALLPRTAEAKGERVRSLLDELWGEMTFETAPIPAAFMATDLASGEALAIRSGALSDAVRASMAIPALLSPWKIGDRWCTDGAVVDPVPVRALREMGVGTVIAATVAGRGNRAGKSRELSDEKAPGVMQVLSSVINASEASRAAAAVTGADIVIAPEVDAASSFDFTDIEAKVEVGRLAALDALEAAELL